MSPRPFFLEVAFSEDPERAKRPVQSEYDIIDHPFRVIVYDSEFHLLRIGTVALGPIDSTLYAAMLFARTTPQWASAHILNRASMSVVDVLVRKLEDQNASRSYYPNPDAEPGETETPPTSLPPVTD